MLYHGGSECNSVHDIMDLFSGGKQKEDMQDSQQFGNLLGVPTNIPTNHPVEDVGKLLLA